MLIFSEIHGASSKQHFVCFMQVLSCEELFGVSITGLKYQLGS